MRFPADPAAELMPAAEFLGHDPDFPAILESFEGSPFDPARRRVLGRLMGVFAMDYQGARSEERRFLRRLLGSRNAREGYAANCALHLCGASHAIRRTLALGVAESRWSYGCRRGFLGAVQARLAATTFQMLGPAARETLWSTLTMAGTDVAGRRLPDADPVIERALVLKALAARRNRLGPWCRSGPDALDEIVGFAGEIRGLAIERLATCTTLDTPELEPPKELYRVLDRARGEMDPIFAWRNNSSALASTTPDTGVEEAQTEQPWEVLPELDRSPIQERPRYHQALAEARARSDSLLSVEQIELLTRFITGRELEPRHEAALDVLFSRLEAEAFDLAPRSSVEMIRADARGIYRFDAARALSDLLSPYTGASYVRRVFSDQLTAGLDPMRQIAFSLDAGMSVPLTINEARREGFKVLSVIDSQALNVRPRDYKLRVDEPGGTLDAYVLGSMLLQPELPDVFGTRARVDAYLAPAALDLLAPPFGIAFPNLGIEDQLG